MIARYSIRDLLSVMAIVAVYCGSFSLIPVLPGFNREASAIFFGASIVGAFVPSIVGAWIRNGITSAHCWQLALSTTLTSAWISFLVLYVFCHDGSSSPQWPGMVGIVLIVASPLIGFIAACLNFTFVVLTIRFANALDFIYWPTKPRDRSERP